MGLLLPSGEGWMFNSFTPAFTEQQTVPDFRQKTFGPSKGVMALGVF